MHDQEEDNGPPDRKDKRKPPPQPVHTTTNADACYRPENVGGTLLKIILTEDWSATRPKEKSE